MRYVRDLLLRLLRLHDATSAERWAALWTAIAFFCVLFAYYLLRPLRENVSFAFPQDDIVWLFALTFGLTTLLNQPYLALVRRLPSHRFLPYALHAFAASFLVLAIAFLGGDKNLGKLNWGDWHGRGHAFFYSWLTAFSVCGVTLVWVHAVEWFSLARGKRLFGLISVGGTLGAMAGSILSKRLAEQSYSTMLCISAVTIEIGIVVWYRSLAACRVMAAGRVPEPPRRDGPSFLQGVRHVAASPYLRGIALFVLLSSVCATTFYYQRVALVRDNLLDDVGRRGIEADINFWQNALSLTLQLFFTSRALLWCGLSVVLCVMPCGSLLGLGALELWPIVGVYGAVEVLRRMAQYAFDKPAREVLYTSLDQEGKYVSKAVIDTAGMRAGDVVGALLNHVVFRFSGGSVVLAVAAPLCATWAFVGWWLGRACGRREKEQRDAVG